MNTENILAALGNTGGSSGLKRAVQPPASNALLGGNAGISPQMKALLEKLKKQTAYQGFDGLLAALGLLNGGGGLLDGGVGGGGGGGGGFCLRHDTPVLMADKSYRTASGIRPGDLIMGFDGGIGNVPQEVFTVTIANQKCFKVTFGDSVIYASSTHNWFVTDGDKLEIVATIGLVPGMLLIREDQTFIAIDSIEEDQVATVYWWNCSPNQNYYAGGVLHHNTDGGLHQVIRDEPVTGGLGQGMGKEELGFTIGVGGS